MIKGMLGLKLGMTQIYKEDRTIPVSVLEMGPCVVVQNKTGERDGYEAVQLGFVELPEKKVNKPVKGYFEKLKLSPLKHLREFTSEKPGEYEVGHKLGVEVFEEGELVKVRGVSKGKGFQGVVKRYHKKIGPRSHGSGSHRQPGSIGMGSSYPSRVHKGKHMPGRMGGKNRSSLNLEVVALDKEKNILMIKGSVPGIRGAVIEIHKTGRKKKKVVVEVKTPKTKTAAKKKGK